MRPASLVMSQSRQCNWSLMMPRGLTLAGSRLPMLSVPSSLSQPPYRLTSSLDPIDRLVQVSMMYRLPYCPCQQLCHFLRWVLRHSLSLHTSPGADNKTQTLLVVGGSRLQWVFIRSRQVIIQAEVTIPC